MKSAVKKMPKAKDVPSKSSRSSRRVSISDISNGVAADESSCSSSTIDSQASRAFVTVTAMPSVASVSAPLVLPMSSQVQGSVFQYFSDYGEQNTVSTSSSSSVQSFNDEPATKAANATLYNTHAIDNNGSNAQPFNDEDMMYLASIFNEDEKHSNEDDLCSFLSLNQETSAGDFMLGL